MSIINLATELIHAIVMRLCPCDYLNLRLTCTTLRDALNDAALRNQIMEVHPDGEGGGYYIWKATGNYCGPFRTASSYKGYHNGTMVGTCYSHTNGIPLEWYHYNAKGERHGHQWELDPNGAVLFYAYYENGKSHGMTVTWNSHGAFFARFDMGKLLHAELYRRNGTLGYSIWHLGNGFDATEYYNYDGSLSTRILYQDSVIVEQERYCYGHSGSYDGSRYGHSCSFEGLVRESPVRFMTKNPEGASLHTLPVELIGAIAELLCPCSYTALATTSRWVCEILRDPAVRKKVMRFVHGEDSYCRFDVKTGLECGPCLSNLGSPSEELAYYCQGRKNGPCYSYAGDRLTIANYKNGRDKGRAVTIGRSGCTNYCAIDLGNRKESVCYWGDRGSFGFGHFDHGLHRCYYSFYSSGALESVYSTHQGTHYCENWNEDGSIASHLMIRGDYRLERRYCYKEGELYAEELEASYAERTDYCVVRTYV